MLAQQFVDKGTINGRIRSCVFGTYRGGVECFQCIFVEVRIFDTGFLQGGCHVFGGYRDLVEWYEFFDCVCLLFFLVDGV